MSHILSSLLQVAYHSESLGPKVQQLLLNNLLAPRACYTSSCSCLLVVGGLEQNAHPRCHLHDQWFMHIAFGNFPLRAKNNFHTSNKISTRREQRKQNGNKKLNTPRNKASLQTSRTQYTKVLGRGYKPPIDSTGLYLTRLNKP